ncbi:antitoxin VbhA family protein [Rhodoferax ferrireducens]|uniref:antitoxin VbhA family protein n=1 Tax=Rhodoferax ferrireducens TaxID=192843 RepID=UPI001300933C|nr:antitoxin VbhA family protein [Rhodoferax ferrireducens]
MKTISKQVMRQKAVSNVLASLRIEKLQPSDEVVRGMNACVSGKETTANVRQRVMRQHVTLRSV